jgi:hypothetical protein
MTGRTAARPHSLAPYVGESGECQARKYNQAAIGYFVYGLIYLAGAIYLGRIGRGPGGTAWWYLIGAAMAFGFPYFIWKRFKWVTRVLAVLLLGRVIGLVRIAARSESDPVPLPWGGEIATSHGALVFMLIAVLTCLLLARAGWQRSPAAA